jgi:tRNA threonylcarbamoyladenosine biosynthesis protein TsaE
MKSKIQHANVAQQSQQSDSFHGDGCRKNYFYQAVSQELGVMEATSSPTFSLVNEYQTIDNQIVYHLISIKK